MLTGRLLRQNGIQSVADLTEAENAALFDSDGDGRGEAWIGVEGWGATPIEQIRAKSYGYDEHFELLVMEEIDALERFDAATAEGQMFLIYCYSPHWMWREYDLLVLDEPEHDPERWNIVFPDESERWLEESNAAVAWQYAELNVYFARSLEEEHPEIAAFLREVRLNEEDLLDIAYGVKEQSLDLERFAEDWVMQNR